jgi:hypothetical protein
VTTVSTYAADIEASGLLPPPIDADSEWQALAALLTDEIPPCRMADLRDSCFTGGQSAVWRSLADILPIVGWVQRAEWIRDYLGPTIAMDAREAMLSPVVGLREWPAVCARLVEFARRRWLVCRMVEVSVGLRMGMLSTGEAVARLRDEERVV